MLKCFRKLKRQPQECVPLRELGQAPSFKSNIYLSAGETPWSRNELANPLDLLLCV